MMVIFKFLLNLNGNCGDQQTRTSKLKLFKYGKGKKFYQRNIITGKC